MNPIYHVTDGPVSQPNGFYKARLIRRHDVNGFFVMESVRVGDLNIVHEHNIRLLWNDNLHESESGRGRAVEVPSSKSEPVKDVASGGSNGAPGCGSLRL